MGPDCETVALAFLSIDQLCDLFAELVLALEFAIELDEHTEVIKFGLNEIATVAIEIHIRDNTLN